MKDRRGVLPLTDADKRRVLFVRVRRRQNALLYAPGGMFFSVPKIER
jgi:hypothetical protein